MSEEVWLRDEGDLWKTAGVLIDRYKDRLGHVDPDRILFVRVVGSTASWLGKVWRVKAPYTLLGQGGYEFILAINDDRCRGIFVDPLMEKMVLLHELQHIGRDGKVEPHDVEDFSWMLREFGVNWQVDGDPAKVAELVALFKRETDGPENPPEGTA